MDGNIRQVNPLVPKRPYLFLKKNESIVKFVKNLNMKFEEYVRLLFEFFFNFLSFLSFSSAMCLLM